MAEQRFGPRRCRDTRKPLAGQCPRVWFYRCDVCGALFPASFPGEEGAGGGREIICCGEKAEELLPVDVQDSEAAAAVTYKIVGGYNDNAIRVSWKGMTPEWIYLKTFTGGYLKYVAKGKRPPVVFALADTDAFAYCDEDPCLECVFRCKRGFVIYAYSREAGFIQVPIDKMTAQWQSGAT